MNPFYLPLGRCRTVVRTCTVIIAFFLFFSYQLNAQTLLSAQTISAATATGGDTQPIANLLDAAGNHYQVGVLRATADLDPGAGVSYFVSNGVEDCYIAKYSAAGAFIWGRSFGGGGQDIIREVALDNSGNIIVAGYFSNVVDFDPGPGVTKFTSNGNWDIFFAKFTAAGDFVFAKALGGITNDSPTGMALDASGNIYLTGTITSPTVDFDPGPGVVNLTKSGSVDAYVARYDNDGNYVWAFNIGSATAGTQVTSNKVKLTTGGALYIGGYLSGGISDFDPGAGVGNLGPVSTGADLFLAKYDLAGNYSWGVVVGGTGTEVVYGMDLDAMGNIYLTGTFSTTVDFNPGAPVNNLVAAGGTDIFLAKYSPAGAYLWASGMGGTNSDYGLTVKIDAANNPIVGGYFLGTADFDPSGTVVNLVSAGTTDGFVAKYTGTTGALTWARRLGSTTNDQVTSMTTDGSSNVYVGGYFTGTVDFDPGAAVFNMTAPGTQAIGFHLKLSSAGNFVSAFSPNIPVNATSNQSVGATWMDGNNNYYITGSFTRTVDFDPGPGTTTLTATGYMDCFIAKYNASGQLLFVKRLGNTSGVQGKGICTDAAGNIYVTGSFTGTLDADPGAGTVNLTGAASDDIFLLKLNSSGNYVGAIVIGGASYEVINAMTIDNAGAIYLTGSFSTTVDFDPGAGTANRTVKGGSDAFVAKYNSSLGFVYASAFGGTSSEAGMAIVVDALGNAYSTGNFWATADFDPGVGVVDLVSAGTNDIYFSKLDVNGNYANAFRLGSTTSDAGNALALDAAGNVYLGGQFNGTVDFDPGAGVEELTSAGTLDGFIAKYDASGNYINAISFGGTLNEMVQRLKLDGKGIIYASGQFSSPELSFSLHGTPQTFANEGNADVFLAAFDPALNFKGGRSVGGGQNEQVGAIAFDDQDNIYLAGTFLSAATIDNLTGTNAFPFRSINASDVFMASFSMLSTLPIKLELFTAVQQQSEVVARWSVSAQVNNAYFTLERSADGSQFTALARVAGCVDCPTRMDYQFIDKQPLAGWSYYRLRQTDLDGRSTYSRIVRVNYSDATGQLTLYPTVTDNEFTLSYNNKTNSSQQATIRIFNAAGNTVHTANILLKPGMNTVPLTLVKQTAGIYYVSLVITHSNTVRTATVIKQR
ncbi:hypothetical protein D3H65_12850 [Paraflavitalea soli]|uniref:T9SS C-terminal target domain-containing protein n=1 Tax=Paraflavitalea soli TaxID=2315862 RepID=A0A3B7MPB3_9BACT|nr:SBBP repeat-containing protein [Paraflavitalea soli]AXY74816.1 hypothetical protein D3H65_12850 [Paraflavitalea soli]